MGVFNGTGSHSGFDFGRWGIGFFLVGCALILFSLPVFAETVTAQTPNWNPMGAGSPNGDLEQQLQKPYIPTHSTGSPPPPPTTINRSSKMPRAAAVFAILSRCKGNPYLCIGLGIYIGVQWYLDNQQLTKSTGSQYSGGSGYCYSRNSGSFCVDDANVSSAASYFDSACRSGGMCDWTGQTIVSSSCSVSGSTVNCSYIYHANGSSSDITWPVTVSASHVSSGTPSSRSPVTDADINSAAGHQIDSNPQQALSDLQSSNLWAPTDETLTTPTPTVQGSPATTTTTSPNSDGTKTTQTQTVTPTTTTACTGSSCNVTVKNETVTNTVVTNSSGQTVSTNTSTDGGNPPPPKTPPDLCVDHPDILACQMLGDAPPSSPTQPINTDTSGWWAPLTEYPFADAQACPQPRTIATHYGNYDISYQPACDAFVKLRWLVLSLASFYAASVMASGFRV